MLLFSIEKQNIYQFKNSSSVEKLWMIASCHFCLKAICCFFLFVSLLLFHMLCYIGISPFHCRFYHPARVESASQSHQSARTCSVVQVFFLWETRSTSSYPVLSWEILSSHKFSASLESLPVLVRNYGMQSQFPGLSGHQVEKYLLSTRQNEELNLYV